jgi:hypothetical protein
VRTRHIGMLGILRVTRDQAELQLVPVLCRCLQPLRRETLQQAGQCSRLGPTVTPLALPTSSLAVDGQFIEVLGPFVPTRNWHLGGGASDRLPNEHRNQPQHRQCTLVFEDTQCHPATASGGQTLQAL